MKAAISDAQKHGRQFRHCLGLEASVVGLHLLFKSLEELRFVGKAIFIHFNNVTHIGGDSETYNPGLGFGDKSEFRS